MQNEDTVTLTDKESVVVLKVLRNNPFNHLKQLVFREKEIYIAFHDATLEPATLSKDEAFQWKDKEWREFFEKNEPLM
jgi:hypothetical protein